MHGIVGKLVDDADLQSARRGDVRSRGNCLQRGFGAGEAGEALRAAGTRNETELHFRQADLRRAGTHAPVTCQSELESAPERSSLDGRNDWFVGGLHPRLHLADDRGLVRQAGHDLVDVGARWKRAAGAGNDDCLHRRLRRGSAQSFHEPLAHPNTQRVDGRVIDLEHRYIGFQAIADRGHTAQDDIRDATPARGAPVAQVSPGGLRKRLNCGKWTTSMS